MYLSNRIKKKIIVNAYLCKVFGVLNEEEYYSIVNLFSQITINKYNEKEGPLKSIGKCLFFLPLDFPLGNIFFYGKLI